MKFRVTLKDPDTLYDAIREAVDLDTGTVTGLDAEELKNFQKDRRDIVYDMCRTWFRWGEYVTLEIDIEAKTCVVVLCGEEG